MPQLSTLKHVADIVVSRILANAADYQDVAAALEEAYPFGDDPLGRSVWLESLLRHAYSSELKTERSPASADATETKQAHGLSPLNEVSQSNGRQSFSIRHEGGPFK